MRKERRERGEQRKDEKRKKGITKELQGGGTAYQWKVTLPIDKENLEVGDLGFKQTPTASGINHVGIYIGNGRWIECYSGHGVGITTGKSFNYYRKVQINFED